MVVHLRNGWPLNLEPLPRPHQIGISTVLHHNCGGRATKGHELAAARADRPAPSDKNVGHVGIEVGGRNVRHGRILTTMHVIISSVLSVEG